MFLKVLDGPHEGRVFDCSRGPLRIGRWMPPSRVLTSNTHDVSRGAVQIERQGAHFVISDYSENGIFVNGEHVHGGSVRLAVGDEIRVGETGMVILADPPDTESSYLGSVEIDEAKLGQVARLFPQMEAKGVVDFLLDQELYRRGQPDPSTGAGHRSSLLRAVPRTPTGKHGFGFTNNGLDGEVERWIIGADVLGLLQINDRSGMRAGDEVLMLLSTAFRFGSSGAYCFRIHGDALVAISDEPWDFSKVQSEIQGRFVEALASATHEALRSSKVDLCFALLHLIVEKPHSPIVLGPLFLAEIERALLISRLLVKEGKDPELLHRTIRLDGFVGE